VNNLREDFVKPIAVLCAICLVCAWAVSATFAVADPLIQAADAQRAIEARQRVLPTAREFAYLDFELPPGVTGAFRCADDTGFVFASFARGYGGDVPIMVGMTIDGAIVSIEMLANSETSGFRERINNPGHLQLFHGLNNPGQVRDVQGVSGATRTDNALRTALANAMLAYEVAARR